MKSKIFSVRPRPIVKRMISVVLLAVLLVVVLWGASAPLFSCTVYALPPALLKARTIGELIVTLFAGAGTAVTNPTIVPAIYSNYDTSAYSFETLIDEGIIQPVDQTLTTEQAVELLGSGNALQTPYNLDADAFRTYVSTNWTQMQDLGVDAVLRLNDIANTDSVYGAIDNLGQLVKDVANYGYLGTSNAIAVITNPGTVVNIGFQNILDSVKSVFGDKISAGVPVTVPSMQYGTLTCKGYMHYYNGRDLYYYAYGEEGYSNLAVWGKRGSNQSNGMLIGSNGKKTKDNVWGRKVPSGAGASFNDWTYDNYAVCWSTSLQLVDSSMPIFETYQEALDYLNNLRINGTTQENTSPDILNETQGNITNLPSVVPSVPNGKGIEIIDGDTYNEYVNTTNNNYINGIPEDNAIVTDDLIQDHLIDDTSQDEPVEPWQNPDIPGTNPINPSQPDLPDKPTLTPEEEIAALTPNADGIISVFPFCIPWDIYAFVKEFNIPRRAPVIHAEIPIPFGGSYVIDLDLSIYDDVAEVCRILILILFIIGLAVASRELIGA